MLVGFTVSICRAHRAGRSAAVSRYALTSLTLQCFSGRPGFLSDELLRCKEPVTLQVRPLLFLTLFARKTGKEEHNAQK